jgi:hypothetical protein
MNPVVTRRLLWLSLLATLPLPYFMVDVGRMPALWLAWVAAFTTASALLDGLQGTWRIALLFIAQTGIYAALLYGVARLAATALHRHVPERARIPAIAGIVALLFAVACLPIYRNYLVNYDPRMRIFDVF